MVEAPGDYKWSSYLERVNQSKWSLLDIINWGQSTIVSNID